MPNRFAPMFQKYEERIRDLEEQLEAAQKAQHVQNLEWAISLAESDPLYAEVFRPYFQKIVDALASNPASSRDEDPELTNALEHVAAENVRDLESGYDPMADDRAHRAVDGSYDPPEDSSPASGEDAAAGQLNPDLPDSPEEPDWDETCDQYLRDQGEAPSPASEPRNPAGAGWQEHTLCVCGGYEAGDHHFDRSLCACGAMHYYCNRCGSQGDSCDSDPAKRPS